MSTWMIIGWVVVVVMIAVNAYVFLQLKKASDQMMKMIAPNAKNMREAVAQIEGMMGGMKGPGNPMAMMQQMMAGGMGGMGGGKGNPAQMKAAMDAMAKMQNRK